MLRKDVYYNFFPTKAEEEAAAAKSIPRRVSRTLVEIRNTSSSAFVGFHCQTGARYIKRCLTQSDTSTGKFRMSQKDMLDCVLRSWPLDVAYLAFAGQRVLVTIFDYSSGSNVAPRKYENDSIYLEKGMQKGPGDAHDDDVFYLGWKDLVRDHKLVPGDEICMYWDTRARALHFKLLRRGSYKFK